MSGADDLTPRARQAADAIDDDLARIDRQWSHLDNASPTRDRIGAIIREAAEWRSFTIGLLASDYVADQILAEFKVEPKEPTS